MTDKGTFLRAVGIGMGLLSVALISGADAPKAAVNSASVMGVRAGRTTAVDLFGISLDPKSLAANIASVTVKLGASRKTDEKTKAKGDSEVRVEITVPANAPPATLELTLTQPDGAKVKTSLPIVEDAATEGEVKKPNTTFEQAMPLPGPSVALEGALDGDQADVFRFDSNAGENWEISVLCGRAGSPLDPVLRVRDAQHHTLVLSAGDKKKDRHVLFHAPAKGTYYIDLTEAESRGGKEYKYRLTVNRRG